MSNGQYYVECQGNTSKSPDKERKSIVHKIVHALLPSSKSTQDADRSGSLNTCSGESVPLIFRGRCAQYAQFCVICASVWIVLFSVTGEQSLPGGNLFSLLVLFAGAVAGGHVFSLIHLPPLLGESGGKTQTRILDYIFLSTIKYASIWYIFHFQRFLKLVFVKNRH